MIRDIPGGVEIAVRVIPRARKSEIAGVRAGALLIRLAAPPVDGAANAALVDFLGRQLDLPARSIRIVSGERARLKRVMISGAAVETVRRLLNLGTAPG
jgi:uncharacterized protein (TIGR00251 family)